RGFLRGRRGTEWAMSGHQVGERFVLLPEVDVTAPLADITRERLYKAVTFGKTLESATAQAFTNYGARLRCYAPVHLEGGADSSGDVELTWVRRTRVGGDWLDLTNVPLGEATELYVVQIWDASYSQCARIIEGITNPTVSYTAADQVTDFGAEQLHVYFTVGQIGALGLGTQARGVAAGARGSDDLT